MASTVTAGKLVINLSENIILNGQKYGGSNTLVINSIDEVSQRIVTCPANVDTTIFRSGVTVDVTDASVDVQDVKYIRLTNLDDTESINVNLQIDTTESGSGASSANETATILLAAGHSFIMGTSHDSVAAYTTDSSVQTVLHDLESILVDPGSNAIDVEIFVASA